MTDDAQLEARAREITSKLWGRFVSTHNRDEIRQVVFAALKAAAEDARRGEREACAKLVESFQGSDDETLRELDLPTQGQCFAAAIRTR